MTRVNAPNRLPSIVRWSVGTLAALALGAFVAPLRVVDPRGAPMFPRVPQTPPDLSTLLRQLGVGSVVWYCAAIALPFMVWGARHLALVHGSRRRTLALSALVITALVATTVVLEYLVVYHGASSRPSLGRYVPVALRNDVLPWIALAGIVAATEARRRAVQSAVERERLRALVAEQRLIALTGQLQPHFLFNTLQGISTLIHRDPEAADEMLAKLSDLLRGLLRHRDRILVPLGEEVSFARTYLEIAQLRFGDRLAFEIDVDASLHDLSVPLFILQPLVENALAHGVGGRLRGGRITVSARRVGDRLQIVVADDGAGLGTSAQPVERVGLSNTRERLRASFGADHQMTIEPGDDRGTVARIDIPSRAHDAAGALA